MKLVIHQQFRSHGPDDIAAAYADPGLYGAMHDLPFVGTPSLVDHAIEEEVSRLAVRWAVQVELPAAARVFVDPSRLSFVEHARLTPDGTASFRIEPDHYRRLLAFAGTYRVERGPDTGARRTVAGELRVDLGWKGRLVEGEVTRVIAAGLTDALQAQVAAVERYLG
jgi:hypothetical protein